jgi:putative ABC transport system substrate-binding protein
MVFAPPAPTLAQNSDKVWRLGVLTLPTSPSSPVFETFPSIVFPELAKQGYVEGRNLVIEIQVGAPDKLPELARELVATRPDAVIAVSSWAIDAVQQASPRTPIVGSFIGVDPIAAGYAKSLARPSSSITGIVVLAPELDDKRVDVLHQTVPSARRIAALARSKRLDAASLAEMEKAATQADLELLTFYAAAPKEFPAAFARMRQADMEALAGASVPEFGQCALLLKPQKAPGQLDHAAADPGVAGSSEPLFPGNKVAV